MNDKPVGPTSSITRSQKAAVKHEIKQRRPIHKRVLLHPASVLMLLCAVVLVGGLTYNAAAATIISSEIFAPALTEGATITSPTDGSVFTTPAPITVSGACPDRSYIEIFVNGAFGGIGLCGTDHTYQIQASLFAGGNNLVAKDFNLTDQPGPTTPAVAVSLQLPKPAASSPSASAATPTTTPATTPATSAAAASSAPPALVLTSGFKWQTFSPKKDFSWKMDVEGGSPPYVVTVAWGDGQVSSYTFKTDPVFTVTHTYQKPGYFAIKVYSKDATGNQHMMQLAALITGSGGTSTFFGKTTTPAINSNFKVAVLSTALSTKNWLWIAWPSILIVGLLMFSFWLGEIQERRAVLKKSTSLARTP